MLEADGGRLHLVSLDPVGDVAVVPPVDVPPDVARRYERFGVRTTMWASNYPPDVPTSSKIAMRIGEEAGLGAVDGVIWSDTVWMADMLAAIGPVSSEAWPEPVSSENLVEVFNRRIFETADPATINQVQAQLGRDLWAALLTRRPEPAALASAMSAGTRSGHLAIFATDADAEETLQRLGAAGLFELGDNPLAVVWQDASANRAGFFAEHDVGSKVTIAGDGSATVRTKVGMRNGAPSGPPSELLGDGSYGVPVGFWGVDVEVYMPTDAIDPTVTVTGPSVTDIDEAYGHPVADAYLFADPGGGSSATVTYRRDAAASEADGLWTYSHPGPAPAIVAARELLPGDRLAERRPGRGGAGLRRRGERAAVVGQPDGTDWNWWSATRSDRRTSTQGRPWPRPRVCRGRRPTRGRRAPAPCRRPPARAGRPAPSSRDRDPSFLEHPKKSSIIARWSPSSEASDTFSARARRARVWIEGST